MSRRKEPEPEPRVEHHHHHHHRNRPTSRRELPVNPDPLATYDALGRKVPKRLGFLEVARGLPWIVGEFDKVVPPRFVTHHENSTSVTVACVCGTAVLCAFNRVTECPSCSRDFVNFDATVRVAGTPG